MNFSSCLQMNRNGVLLLLFAVPFVLSQGVSQRRGQYGIINGEKATNNQCNLLYYVRIFQQCNILFKIPVVGYFCGGSLITPTKLV